MNRFYLFSCLILRLAAIWNKICLLQLIKNKVFKKEERTMGGMEKFKNYFSTEVAKTMIKTESKNRKTLIIILGVVFGLFAIIMESVWFYRLQSVSIWN